METLAREAQALFNLQLSRQQLRALKIYENELVEWNQKFNLTAIRDS
jgi:16S rRNA G527 N7-methylase RsmG